MIVTMYWSVQADMLRPGDVILDVPQHDREILAPVVGSLPTSHVVDEISERLDGRKVYTFPIHRSEGKRRVWTFKPDEMVDVELSGRTAADLIRSMSAAAVGNGAAMAVLAVTMPVGTTVQLEEDDGDE